jgi:protoporphyrinogen oxidase
MAIKDLIASFRFPVPHAIREAASGLRYRDLMTVGLLVKNLAIQNNTPIKTINDLIPDNWIYIQDPTVRLARMQIFNNWSPYLVRDPETVWLGLEYFCTEGDRFWNTSDGQFIEGAIDELARIGIIHRQDVLDSTLIRTPKAYPAYWGSYEHFGVLRQYLDGFENLFLIGRNGMHRYNNQDHSMLTAMAAVDVITNGLSSKEHIWNVTVEGEYHEEH